MKKNHEKEAEKKSEIQLYRLCEDNLESNFYMMVTLNYIYLDASVFIYVCVHVWG